MSWTLLFEIRRQRFVAALICTLCLMLSPAIMSAGELPEHDRSPTQERVNVSSPLPRGEGLGMREHRAKTLTPGERETLLSHPMGGRGPVPVAYEFAPQVPAAPESSTTDQVELDFVPITQLKVNILPKTHDEQGRTLMMAPDPAAEYFAADARGVKSIEQVRMWGLLEYQWEAPAVCYNPLYFEEVNAERYGNTFGCWQPWVSGAHFYATVGLMPLKLLIEPPHDCVYTLGHYRPGRCVPFEWHCNSIGRLRGCCSE